MKAIMDIAYLTAQRIGDVLRIRLSDINKGGVAFEQEKTGKRLIVGMSPVLKMATNAERRMHGSKIISTYLSGQRNGKMRYLWRSADLFKRSTEISGVKNAHLHDLRAKNITDAKK